MKPEEPIFADVLELPPAERAAFLDRACEGNAGLRARVESLLRAYAGAGVEIEGSPLAPAFGPAPRPPLDFQPGSRIGRYKLLQQLGEGGCGVVFLAEQEDPVRRRVALKIIKLGMDTREVIARFEAERQALALMDHPNIARVLDAGATETGRPFFVMELVRGIPITRHCDEHRLGPDARLRLFVQICHAIQHAHHKGIIHRDLKPSNILVTMHDGVAIPKVIDFGIAKATQGRLTDRTLFTAFEQFVGTPAYMSPEQTEMSALDVDTRSDVYSLGVLLYELLTGRTPFDTQELVRSGLDALRRTIREQNPAKPSTRVHTFDAATRTAIAQQRGTEPAKLAALLRGDLDWIVMRCLEKDRSRRYETANGLAMDIERHLANQPVLARSPGALYVIGKVVRRNKLAFAAAGAVLVSLVAGLVSATTALRREHAAAARSEQVARFMKDMLAGVRPQMALGRDTTMLRAILDETVERLPRELRGQPEVEADLRETLGNVYRDLDELRSAILMHQTALRLRRQTFGAEHVAVAASLHNLGDALARHGELAEAEDALREALALREKLLGFANPLTADTRALLTSVAGPRPQSATEPLDQPAVIRIAHAGGRASGRTYNGGDVLATVHQQGALETEFNPDGIRIEWTYFPSGPALNAAGARQAVDFGYAGDAGAIVARATGQRNQVLLAMQRGAHSNYVVVRADAPFQSIADLKGRRFATVRRTAGHLMLCRVLERQGLSERDVTLVDLENAAAIQTTLEAGTIDAHLMTLPFELEAQGVVRVIYDSGRDPGLPSQTGVFWVAEDFARRHPAIVQRVVRVVVATAAWQSDERNRDAVLALSTVGEAARAGLARTWENVVLKERFSPLFDERFRAVLRRAITDARRFGLIETDVSLDDWLEPKYLERALVELGLQEFWAAREPPGR